MGRDAKRGDGRMWNNWNGGVGGGGGSFAKNIQKIIYKKKQRKINIFQILKI